MTALTKTSAKQVFAAFAQPTSADFSDLIDSWTDFSALLTAFSASAAAGSRGVFVVSGASTGTFVSAAAVGIRLLNMATTAAAVSQLGAGAAGSGLFAAVTTANAVAALGAATVGTQILQAATTAAVQTIVGGSTSAATQAEMEAGSSNTVFATPGNSQYHPSSPKAWVSFGGVTTASIRASYNVASVTRTGAGTYSISFTTPFSSGNYCWITSGDVSAGVNNAARDIQVNSVSAAGIIITTGNGVGGVEDWEMVNAVFFGDQ